MLRVAIPEQPVLELEHVVLDLNGTLSDRGVLDGDVASRARRVGVDMRLHLLTADTYGTARQAARDIGATLKIVARGDNKRDYVDRLGPHRCVAIGNGANDAAMLERAAVGIAVLGWEGASPAALGAADIVCRSAAEALDLLLTPLALTATLRP
jgi:soluble P-type ATPase